MDESNMFIEKCQRMLDTLIIAYRENYRPPMELEHTKVGLFHKKTSIKSSLKFPPTEKQLAFGESLSAAEDFHKMMFRSENHKLSFVMLWEYSEFIRWCEKMFLYENNPSQTIYSDTPIDSIDTRTLVINKIGFSIIINLKMSQRADFDNKSDKLIFHEIEEINIKRNYGKELMNKFRIIDDNVKFNDESDKLLLDLVTEIIFDDIGDNFLSIIKNIDSSVFVKNALFNHRFITP